MCVYYCQLMTACEVRISDGSSEVFSSDLPTGNAGGRVAGGVITIGEEPRRSAPCARRRVPRFLDGAQRMCVSLRETRREYVHVASSSTSMSPTVSRRDTHILTPPQARRPASGSRSIDPPAWPSVVERLCPHRDRRRQERKGGGGGKRVLRR